MADIFNSPADIGVRGRAILNGNHTRDVCRAHVSFPILYRGCAVEGINTVGSKEKAGFHSHDLVSVAVLWSVEEPESTVYVAGREVAKTIS
jgi:hypothetical protein